MTTGVAEADLYAGLSGLDLHEQAVDFGKGVTLRPTFAHLFSTDVLAFERPAAPHSFHPGPWQAISHKRGTDITAELLIPKEFRHQKISSVGVARTIVTLLRLWTDPQITLEVLTDCRITYLRDHKYSGPDGKQVAMLVGGRQRHIDLALQSRDKIVESIEWVTQHWHDALQLKASSPEFDFVLETFDSAQMIPNTAMMLVSLWGALGRFGALWGALEAIFAQTNAELRFRVSSQIAAYLTPRGPSRLEKQREVLKLYDKRSAAAHGAPKHGPDELVKTFELLRRSIIRIIENKTVPSKTDLEELLFAS